MARRRMRKTGNGGKPTKYDKKQDRKIVSLQNKVKPEYKVHLAANGTNVIPASATNAMSSTNMTAIPQGATGQTRIGDKVAVYKIRFKAIVANDQLAVSLITVPNFVRFVILYDRRYNGSALVGGEVLQQYNVVSGSNENALSPLHNDYINGNLKKGKSVDVLYDKTHYVGYYSDAVKNISFVKTFKKPKIINYIGSSNIQGQIYVMVFGGSSTTAANNPLYAYETAVYYTDM